MFLLLLLSFVFFSFSLFDKIVMKTFIVDEARQRLTGPKERKRERQSRSKEIRTIVKTVSWFDENKSSCVTKIIVYLLCLDKKRWIYSNYLFVQKNFCLKSNCFVNFKTFSLTPFDIFLKSQFSHPCKFWKLWAKIL